MASKGKVIHVRLDAEATEKLEWLAQMSRRPEAMVVRLLIKDAPLHQLGVLEDATYLDAKSARIVKARLNPHDQ